VIQSSAIVVTDHAATVESSSDDEYQSSSVDPTSNAQNWATTKERVPGRIGGSYRRSSVPSK
jgi:hypothetical protein